MTDGDGKLDDETRRFRRRLDDRPEVIWRRRAFWMALGAAAMWAYVTLAHVLAEGLHRVPR